MNNSDDKKPLVSIRAFTILTMFYTVGTSILITPGGLNLHAKQDAWIACLFGIALDLALVWVFSVLGERYPDLTIIQYSRVLLGRWLGGAAGLLFSAFCYLLAALLVADLGYFLTTQVMSDTPIEALAVIFIAAVAYTARQGMRVYSLTAEMLFPWVTLLLVILLFPVFNKFDVQTLRPVFEFGYIPVAKGGASFSMLQEVAVLLVLYPFVSKGKGRRNGYLAGTAIGGAVLFSVTAGSEFVLGVELTANHVYPSYALAKNIRMGHMIERVEGLLMFIWVCSVFIKTVVTFHASVIGLNQTLGIRDSKLLIWPLAIGLFPVAMASYTNIVFAVNFVDKYWAAYAFPFIVLFPLLLLCLSFIRHGRRSVGYDRPPGRPS
ncbi:GerAB/ArcD/ProY family transporter [Cohnella zeiphila]|uniref:Endospore germination permease n=1 Tax=Cohnella zeiphila TaxID=2761120 RepID=A0A7X0SJU0_9BACL|nr:endospore germination permease [Cohnella zeiphila]MBB6731186.1 endospore germination permease [Cohnella zeiphila]